MNELENKRLGELLMALGKGKISALTEIAELIKKILYSVGLAYYKNKEDTEDAIQNLYLILCKKAKFFRKNVNACAWIVQIFKNEARTYFRKTKTEKLYIESEKQNPIYNKTIDEQYIENYLFVKEMFSNLSEYEQDLLIYYYWCKCTVREVAVLVRRPKSTVGTHLKNLEEKIKKKY